jgi:hypothetical protein
MLNCFSSKNFFTESKTSAFVVCLVNKKFI